jgi:hypothetical protein
MSFNDSIVRRNEAFDNAAEVEASVSQGRAFLASDFITINKDGDSVDYLLVPGSELRLNQLIVSTSCDEYVVTIYEDSLSTVGSIIDFSNLNRTAELLTAPFTVSKFGSINDPGEAIFTYHVLEGGVNDFRLTTNTASIIFRKDIGYRMEIVNNSNNDHDFGVTTIVTAYNPVRRK